MLLSGFLCLDVLHAPIHLWFYVSALKAVCLSSLFFKNRLLARSSLVTKGSDLPGACQLRPDIALTEPEQLNNLRGRLHWAD